VTEALAFCLVSGIGNIVRKIVHIYFLLFIVSSLFIIRGGLSDIFIFLLLIFK
jgi:hypothetical protein